MINRCRKCDEILKEGDYVRVLVRSTYHLLKSKVAFAISRDITDAYGETLEHDDCMEKIGGTN